MILQAWLTLPSCLASSSSPTLPRMIFCSRVIVSSVPRTPAGSPPAGQMPTTSPPSVRSSPYFCRTGHLGVGVDEGLLVDPSDPLHGADVEGVLRAAAARALALELAVRLVVLPGLL